MIRPTTPIPQPSKPIPLQHPLELLPASLLPYRQTWQPLIRSLPNNTCLIVTNLGRQAVSVSMLRVADALRRQGQAVYVLSVG